MVIEATVIGKMIHGENEDSEQKKAKDRGQQSSICISLLVLHNRVPHTGWLTSSEIYVSKF